MPTHLVPLTNLLHEQASYWAPWQTGVRGDSVLCRELRSQQHLVDLQQVLQHYSDKMPEAGRKDIYNWEYRMQLITKIALDLRQFLKARTPVDTHTSR